MKKFAASLIAVVVLIVVSPVSVLADTWGEPINTPDDRFIVLSSYNDQAVYDKETGLVWEKSPTTAGLTLSGAHVRCNQLTLGNRKGWRLPTLQELASLVQPGQFNPSLPPGNPFTVQLASYWSATTSSLGSVWFVNFSLGFTNLADSNTGNIPWCVRGGQGVDIQ